MSDWIDEDISEGRRVEIERLRLQVSGLLTEISLLNGEINNKDAEIERLKEENAHLAWRDKDKNQLITELADALNNCQYPDDERLALLDRARAAVSREVER